jgi:hypothetical protein
MSKLVFVFFCKFVNFGRNGFNESTPAVAHLHRARGVPQRPARLRDHARRRRSNKSAPIQGDQIGPTFAYWAIVYCGQFFELLFTTVPKSYALILGKKWVGKHFRRYFRKLIWSPCPHFILGRTLKQNSDKTQRTLSQPGDLECLPSLLA